MDMSGQLLPQPHRISQHTGTFRLVDGMGLHVVGPLEQPEITAAESLRSLCADRGQVGLEVLSRTVHHSGRGIVLSVADGWEAAHREAGRSPQSEREAQGYHLRILPGQVELVGSSPAGLFNGLQTLRQMLLAYGRAWPCLDIHDLPDFPVRGLSHDVSRGKVPTLETLKHLVDRLAGLKVNQLHLYVEHTFAFQFNPNIGRGCSPLTAEEIRELDAYCALRRVELVPSLASCGHMGGVLSLRECRHLAEIESGKIWSEMTWPERMHGLTLDVTNPQSRSLLEKMYAEFLPLFSSGLVNVCCDETYDLGKGKNRSRADEIGVGRLYLEHLRWLSGLCRRHGKRMMFWGDVIKKHPDLIDEIPQGAIVLNWGYTADADYESTALFCDAGLSTYVCPGTSAWNRVTNDINVAELNIRRHAAAGRKYGAVGLLNTDWGDDGHVNLLAGSWHPIALGAAMAWNANAPLAEDFDRAFSRLVFGDDTGELVTLLRRAVAAASLPRSWPMLYAPLAESIPTTVVSDEALAQLRSCSSAAASAFSRHTHAPGVNPQDMPELEISCRMNVLLADRLALSRELPAVKGRPDSALAEQLLRFAADCEALAPQYENLWLARNKRARLDEILAVFRRLADGARQLASQADPAG
ncbi:MAG: beta-N-acetylhexosaminidase [Planctomycetota bacterium]